jgi:hypothetical protein
MLNRLHHSIQLEFISGVPTFRLIEFLTEEGYGMALLAEVSPNAGMRSITSDLERKLKVGHSKN